MAHRIPGLRQSVSGGFGGQVAFEQNEQEVRLTRHSAQPMIAKRGDAFGKAGALGGVVITARGDEILVCKRG